MTFWARCKSWLVPLFVCCSLTNVAPASASQGHAAVFEPLQLAGLTDNIPQLLLNTVNKKIAGRLLAERFDYEAPSTVTLYGVKIEAPGGETVVAVRKLRVSVSVKDLFSGALRFEEIAIGEPELNLTVQKGKLNLERAFTPRIRSAQQTDAEEGESLDMVIDRLSINKGSLRFDDGAGLKVRLNKISTKGTLELHNEDLLMGLQTLAFESGRFENESLGLNLAASQLTNAKLVGPVVRFDALTLKTLGGSVRLKGQVNRKGTGRINLAGSFNLPQNAWPEKVEPLAFETPQIQGDLNIAGPLASPTIRLNARFGELNAYDYAIQSGRTKVQIDSKEIQLSELEASFKTGGKLGGNLTYDLDQKTVTLQQTLTAIPLRTLVPGTTLAQKLKGRLGGTVGAVVDLKSDETQIQADYQLTVRNFKMAPLQLPTQSRLRGAMSLQGQSLTFRQNRITAEDLLFGFNGKIHLGKETLALNTRLETRRLNEMVSQLPEDLLLGQTEAEGKVTGTFDRYLYEGDLRLATLDVSGVPITDLSTAVTVTPDALTVPELTAEISGGLCTLALSLDLTPEEHIGLAGNGELRAVQLASLELAQPESAPLTGAVSTQFQIAGTSTHPEVTFALQGEQIETEGLQATDLDMQGQLIYPRLLISTLAVHANNLNLSSENFELDLDAMVMAGILSLNHLDAASFASSQDVAAEGQVAGWIKLRDQIKHPHVEAGLFLSDLVYDGRELGDAKIRATATPIAATEKDYKVVSNGLLAGEKGSLFFRAYHSTATDEVLAQVQLQDLDLQHFGGGWSDSVPTMDGHLQGKVKVGGTLSNPLIQLTAQIPQLGLLLEEPNADDDLETENNRLVSNLSPFHYLGSVKVQGALNDGLIEAQVCAFPNFTPQRRTRNLACTNQERLQVKVRGKLSSDAPSHVSADLEMDFDDLGQYLPVIARSQIESGIHLVSSLQATQESPDADWAIKGSGRMLAFDFASPQAPRFDLKQPFAVQFTSDSVRLNTPVELVTESGRLTLSGYYTPEAMELDANGQMAFALLGLFTDSISHSEGLLNLQVEARGSSAQPRLTGTLEPQKGSFVHIAAIDQDLIFHKGKLAFAQESSTADDAEEQIRISFLDLQTKTDNGDLNLDGDVLLNPVSSELFDSTPVSEWNLAIQGSGLTYHTKGTHVECASQLNLRGTGKAPRLEGQLEITEGDLEKEFMLNNFVITAADDAPSAPLTETLYFMEDLEFDVNILIQHFAVHTLLNSFSLDTDLQGALHLGQDLSKPLLTGSIELTEGHFIFPYAQFDLASATVEFKQTPGQIVDPHFRLEGWAEVSQRDIPQLTQEALPLVLVLEGNLDEMKLDFRAEDGSDYSRTDLLALVLLGYLPSLPGDSGAAGGPSTDNALRAVSRELTASTRKQVEELLQKNLGANVQVDLYADSSGVKTGVRWYLGKRLELEGAGGIQFGSDAAAQNNDLRLRFLIFDHLPYGKELFLEGGLASPPSLDQNTSPRGDIRLTYRILEQ